MTNNKPYCFMCVRKADPTIVSEEGLCASCSKELLNENSEFTYRIVELENRDKRWQTAIKAFRKLYGKPDIKGRVFGVLQSMHEGSLEELEKSVKE